jgi:hypothetical protein
VLVAFLQAFERIESRDPQEWAEGMQVSLSSGNGTKVALVARKEGIVGMQ